MEEYFNNENYFSLEEYISKIKLSDNVLSHLEATNNNFSNYFKALSAYDSYSIIYFWIDSLYTELNSTKLASCDYSSKSLISNDIFFESLSISNNRIHKLHSFLMGMNDPSNYRDIEVKVSGVLNKVEDIHYIPPKPEFIKQFMNDFIKVYKNRDISTINSSPFLKAALLQLLFIRIQPYQDGNSRTGRMINNIKFTEEINRLYGTNLKICPLNISQSINMYLYEYKDRIKNVYFGLNEDTNKEINAYFNFILNMYDEQITYSMHKLEKSNDLLNMLSSNATDNVFKEKADAMKLQRILK